MRFDNKQRILFAIYVEYQNDLSDYAKINNEALSISPEIFDQCITKLLKEELIERCYNDNLETIYAPSLRGLEYVEKLFKIGNSLANAVKIERVGYEFQEAKDNALVDFVKKTLVLLDKRYEEYFKTNKFRSRYDF